MQLVGDGRHQTGDHGRCRGAAVSQIGLVLLVLRRDQGRGDCDGKARVVLEHEAAFVVVVEQEKH